MAPNKGSMAPDRLETIDSGEPSQVRAIEGRRKRLLELQEEGVKSAAQMHAYLQEKGDL